MRYVPKVVVDRSRSVVSQVERLQRGQWIAMNNMGNGRVVNKVGNVVLVLMYGHRGKQPEVLTFH